MLVRDVHFNCIPRNLNMAVWQKNSYSFLGAIYEAAFSTKTVPQDCHNYSSFMAAIVLRKTTMDKVENVH